jgi:hypothetical protein
MLIGALILREKFVNARQIGCSDVIIDSNRLLAGRADSTGSL